MAEAFRGKFDREIPPGFEDPSGEEQEGKGGPWHSQRSKSRR